MAWIESHQALRDHPKVLDLSRRMKWSLDETLGKLHRFWWWCLDYAPDGILTKHSATTIAASVGLPEQAGKPFLAHLIASGLVDQVGKTRFVHDWVEYAGRYLRDTKYRRAPEKYTAIVQFYAEIVSRQSARHSQPTVSRQSAVPNQPTNLPNQPLKSPASQVVDKRTGQGANTYPPGAREQVDALTAKIGRKMP